MMPLGDAGPTASQDAIAAPRLPWHVTRLGAGPSTRSSRAPAQRPRRRGRRPRPRAVHAPLRAQPRHPADAVPQHGADVARRPPPRTSPATPRCSRRRWGRSWRILAALAPAHGGLRRSFPAPSADETVVAHGEVSRRGVVRGAAVVGQVVVVEESFAGMLEARGFGGAAHARAGAGRSRRCRGSSGVSLRCGRPRRVWISTDRAARGSAMLPTWQALCDGARVRRAAAEGDLGGAAPGRRGRGQRRRLPRRSTRRASSPAVVGPHRARARQYNRLETPDPALPAALLRARARAERGGLGRSSGPKYARADADAPRAEFERVGAGAGRRPGTCPGPRSGPRPRPTRTCSSSRWPADYPAPGGRWTATWAPARVVACGAPEGDVRAAGRRDGALIDVSLGSLGAADVDLMERLIALLADSAAPLRRLSGPAADELLSLAPNMVGAEVLPQTAVLPHVDLVITHAGIQHRHRVLPLRAAHALPADLLGPARQRDARGGGRRSAGGSTPTGSRTPSYPPRSTRCSPRRHGRGAPGRGIPLGCRPPRARSARPTSSSASPEGEPGRRRGRRRGGPRARAGDRGRRRPAQPGEPHRPPAPGPRRRPRAEPHAAGPRGRGVARAGRPDRRPPRRGRGTRRAPEPRSCRPARTIRDGHVHELLDLRPRARRAPAGSRVARAAAALRRRATPRSRLPGRAPPLLGRSRETARAAGDARASPPRRRHAARRPRRQAIAQPRGDVAAARVGPRSTATRT